MLTSALVVLALAGGLLVGHALEVTQAATAGSSLSGAPVPETAPPSGAPAWLSAVDVVPGPGVLVLVGAVLLSVAARVRRRAHAAPRSERPRVAPGPPGADADSTRAAWAAGAGRVLRAGPDTQRETP